MQNKHPRPRAIDNFIPTGRPLGGTGQAPRQNFPDVGMTLSSYRGTIGTQRIGYNERLRTQPINRTYESVRPHPKPKKRRWSKKKIAFWVLLPFLLIGLWLGFKFISNASKIFNGNFFSIFSTTRLKGEDQGRVNILIAGNSSDDAGHDGGELTDSIMIMSLDTKNNRAFLLSIPRDLYVPIPGNGHAKINEAYVDGQREHFSQSGYPGGGMGLLEKVVNDDLGVHANYYALINYAALRDAVNAVGGVDFTIKSSDPRGLYDGNIDYTTHGPLVDLSNGTHHLSGEEALDLARARGDPPARSYGFENSDYTRTANQRMLLLALKNKIFSTGTLANPVRLSGLFDSLGQNVQTDMQLSEVRRLYDLTKALPDSGIKSYGLNNLNGKNYLHSYRTHRGQSALIPASGVDDFGDIQRALHKLMSNSQIIKEAASVVVLNGTDINGLAGKNQDLLTERNISVAAVGDATQPATKTYIINAAGQTKPSTLQALENLYGNKVTNSNPYAGKYHADFIVVLGDDRVADLN